MKFWESPVQKKLVRRIFVILAALFLLQSLLGGFLIYQITLKETTSQLATITKRAAEDLSFQNGTWDTNRYDADPELPGTYPLYVLGTDGYVVDRWKPLHGFLDTSDAKRLLSYTAPQTISADINQSWRVLSKQITSNDHKVGVLTVAYFNPTHDQLPQVDTQLEDNANFILSKITVVNGAIYTKNLDFRDLSYNVVFQIVDQYNNVITKTDNNNSIDRIPNFIDTSYIGEVLHSPHIQQIADNVSGERFILHTQPIYNSQNYVVGVVVAGKSIAFLNTILRDYGISELILSFVLLILATPLVVKVASRYAKDAKKEAAKKQDIHTISFDKKTATIFLDRHEIKLPYATNQYYLVATLFSAPKKRWELDELLEKFGEVDITNSRKAYDAMNMINKKVTTILSEKLIIVKDKLYQLNPTLLQKIQ